MKHHFICLWFIPRNVRSGGLRFCYFFETGIIREKFEKIINISWSFLMIFQKLPNYEGINFEIQHGNNFVRSFFP